MKLEIYDSLLKYVIIINILSITMGLELKSGTKASQ